jgi:hypothetical protein
MGYHAGIDRREWRVYTSCECRHQGDTPWRIHDVDRDYVQSFGYIKG